MRTGRFAIESLQRLKKPAPFAKTEDEVSISPSSGTTPSTASATTTVPNAPRRSCWGAVREPVVGGEKSPTARSTRSSRGTTVASTTRPRPRRDQDDVDLLHQILELHRDDPSQAPHAILAASSFEEGKRADIAARRGITDSTDDNHRQAAFKALRDSLAADVEVSTAIDRSIWYDHVEELIERQAARLRGRSSSKKGKRGNSE